MAVRPPDLGLHQGFSRVMVYHTRSSKPDNASSPETGTGAAARRYMTLFRYLFS